MFAQLPFPKVLLKLLKRFSMLCACKYVEREESAPLSPNRSVQEVGQAAMSEHLGRVNIWPEK